MIDGEKPEISDMSEVYTDTWGKMVKHVVLRKYSDGRDIVYHMEPNFEILEIVGDEKVIPEKGEYDEKHHLDDITEPIVAVYRELKKRSLEINSDLVFNFTKSYISIRKDKNVAFIRFSRKRLRLVAIRAETEIRELVTKYEVRSLPDSVKQFWGGDCADILMEDLHGIDEVMDVLAPIIQAADD